MESFFQKYTRIVNSWIWKRVDVDNSMGFQCVDWVRQFTNEIGYPITNRWNAIDLWKKWLWQNYIRRTYDVPAAWDVVCFNIGKYWHIWIATNNCRLDTLFVVEQNRTWSATWKGRDAISVWSYPRYKMLWYFTHK